MKENDQHWVSKLRSARPYRAVHGDDQPQPGNGGAGTDWKVFAGAAIIVLTLLAGIVVAIRSVDSASGWLDLTSLRVTNDEAFVYLLLETAGFREPDWERVHYRIAIDTYDAARGARTLPAPWKAKVGSGIEFVIDLGGPDASEILVVEGYDPFDGENPIYSRRQADGFRALEVQTNRERFSRDGRYFPPVSVRRGDLRFGSTAPDGDSDTDTRADVAIGEGLIEIRIPWSLLNVSDPSSRTVLHSLERGRESIGTVRTEGLRFYAYSFETSGEGAELMDRIPSGSGVAPLFRWETWERPYHQLLPKLGVDSVKEAMQSIPDFPADPRPPSSQPSSP